MLINLTRITKMIAFFNYGNHTHVCIIKSGYNHMFKWILILIFIMIKVSICPTISSETVPRSLIEIVTDKTELLRSIFIEKYTKACQNNEVPEEITKRIDCTQNIHYICRFFCIYMYFTNNNLLAKEEELDLSNKNVEELPYEIAKHWSGLKKLILRGNKNLRLDCISFKLLSSKLEELDISECDLSKDDIKLISNCVNLKKLDISENPRLFLYDLNISSWPKNLDYLRLSNVGLKKGDFLELMKLEKIEYLDVSDNLLSLYLNEITDFGCLRESLVSLNLRNTGLRFMDMKKLQKCHKLKILDISYNHLYNEKYIQVIKKMYMKKNDWGSLNNSLKALSFIGMLKNTLTILDIQKSFANEFYLVEIFACSNLYKLNFSGNCILRNIISITNSDAKKSLKNVNFSSCEIDSLDFFINILSCSELEVCDISNNPLTLAFIDEILLCQDRLVILKMLSLSQIKLSFFNTLKNFTVLETLDMSYSIIDQDSLYYDGPKNDKLLENSDFLEIFNQEKNFNYDLGALKNSLKFVCLKACIIKRNFKFLMCITDCPKLLKLDCSRNLLYDLPSYFKFGASRHSLISLNMSYCGLKSCKDLQKITDFPNLQNLNVSNNNFIFFYDGFKFKSSKYSLKDLKIHDSKTTSINILYAISECQRLENLDISRNIFSDIPDKFNLGAAAKSLIKIKAEACRMNTEAGLFAFTDCIKLKTLILNYNNFSIISNTFILGRSLETLEYISINGCSFKSHELFRNFTDCPKLKEIDLSNNRFFINSNKLNIGCSKHSLKTVHFTLIEHSFNYRMILEITSCPFLENLYIFGHFDGQEYDFGVSRFSLITINIQNSHFTSIGILNSILDCPKLYLLDISGVSLFTIENMLDIKALGASKYSLNILNVANCRCTNLKCVLFFTSFEKLKNFNFSKNLLDRTSKESIKLGEAKNSLRNVCLEDCNIFYSSDILELTSCPCLIMLNLNQNNLISIPETFRFGISKYTLQILYLTNNYLNSIIWRNILLECKSLRILDLSQNNLGKIPDIFTLNPFIYQIEELKLSQCNINSIEILDQISNLHGLKHLDLSNNILDFIPVHYDFGNLPHTLLSLRYINVFMNNGESSYIMFSRIFSSTALYH